MTTTDPTITTEHPSFASYDGIWALTGTTYNDEFDTGILVTIDGSSGNPIWNPGEEWVGEPIGYTEVTLDCVFVGGPRRPHGSSKYSTERYENVPQSYLRRPTAAEVFEAARAADLEVDHADRAVDAAAARLAKAQRLSAELDALLETIPED